MLKRILLYTIGCGLMLVPQYSISQEVDGVAGSASIKVPEWVEFQSTQEKLVEQNTRILGDLAEVRNNISQININLLSWQDAVQEAVAGKDVTCDIGKTKYDPRVEWTVIALALLGVYLGLGKISSRFSKDKTVKK